MIRSDPIPTRFTHFSAHTWITETCLAGQRTYHGRVRMGLNWQDGQQPQVHTAAHGGIHVKPWSYQLRRAVAFFPAKITEGGDPLSGPGPTAWEGSKFSRKKRGPRRDQEGDAGE
jgi:hypothetical protein